MFTARLSNLKITTLAIIACAIGALHANAQSYKEIPKELQGIDITENLNGRLPLNAEFVDSSGKTVKLGDYFKEGRPVIITLNYLRCPMLCTLQLNGLLDGLNEVDFKPSTDFQVITISFDPREDAELAGQKKEVYTDAYEREGAKDGWEFLTGTQNNIDLITEAIGFKYRWNEEKQEWAHGAAIFIATPGGRLSRYLYGVSYDPKTLRLGILEGSEGKIGSTIDRFLMWCFHYDDKTGQYTVAVMNIMRLAGAIMVLVLVIGIFILWRRDKIKRAVNDKQNFSSIAGLQS